MGADPTGAYKAERANYLNVVGQNVRTLREEIRPRLSQERLAESTGLHCTEIGKLEKDGVTIEPPITPAAELHARRGTKAASAQDVERLSVNVPL